MGMSLYLYNGMFELTNQIALYQVRVHLKSMGMSLYLYNGMFELTNQIALYQVTPEGI